MIDFLQQRYPPPPKGKRGLLISALFGIFIGAFLLFFQPFALNLLPAEGKVLKMSGFGLITALVFLVFHNGLPVLLSALFTKTSWTVLHQIGFYLLLLLCIATLNGLYINFLNDLSFSWANYRWIIIRTLVLGGIPIAFLILIDHNRRVRRHLEAARQVPPQPATAETPSPSPVFLISTELKGGEFELHSNDFLFAKAEGNYVTFVFQSGANALHRLSLQSLEQQLQATSLKRCHRSYLVNLEAVAQVTGNAQGLQLRMVGSDQVVPVSRKYISVVRAYFEKLSA